MNEAKELLGKTNFKMTRFDILYEENKKVILGLRLPERTKIDHRFKKKFSIFEKYDDIKEDKVEG